LIDRTLQKQRENGRSLHLAFATRWRTQRSLNLRLVDSVNRQPRERAADHQRPDRVSSQWIRIETETTESHIAPLSRVVATASIAPTKLLYVQFG